MVSVVLLIFGVVLVMFFYSLFDSVLFLGLFFFDGDWFVVFLMCEVVGWLMLFEDYCMIVEM